MSKFNQTPPEIPEEPDDWKTIPEEQPKVFHAKVIFEELTQPWSFGSITVRAGNKTIGYVVGVHQEFGQTAFEMAMDYATPERLEIENGTLFAKFEHNSIVLTKKKLENSLVTYDPT